MSDEPGRRVPRPPEGLSTAGKRLWRAITGKYVLRVDELAVLLQACRIADVIDRLDAVLVDAPLIVAGSQGQQREHPALSECRQQRSTLARLLAQLRLPDADEIGLTPAQRRSAAGRALVRRRWG